MPLKKNDPRDSGISWLPATGAQKKRWEKAFGKVLKINRHYMKVVICTDLQVYDRDCFGCFDPNTRTLFIDVTAGNPWETLIHELVHAEIAESGLRQTGSWNADIEEIVCEVMSATMLHNFKIRKK